MKIYVASKLENIDKVKLLNAALRAAGHTITYDWTAHGPVWRDGPARIQQVSLDESQGVCDADIAVVLLPGGRGTHFELGLAYGMLLCRTASGRPVMRIILIGDSSHHLAGSETCAFYHLPAVEWAEDAESLVELLAAHRRADL